MATILNGKQVAAEIRAELKTRAEALRKDGVVPCLAVLLAGDDPASKIYVRIFMITSVLGNTVPSAAMGVKS